MTDIDTPITASNKPVHPGFTPAAFDRSVHKAFLAGLTARSLGSGQWVVDSGTIRGLSYLTTERDCPCKGSAMTGRCYHRAMVCFLAFERRQDRTEDTGDTAA